MNKTLFARGTGLLAGAALISTAFSSTAFAQADDAIALEEVIVTAEKVERDLQKTAISIQVVSGEQLAAEGKKRIDEIISGTVGLQVQDGPTGATVFMRGINGTLFASAAGAANASTVAIVIDGVYQARSEAVRGSTLDVSQVEVMRGTQSTTLGASSLIGAVSVVTNQPTFNFEGNGSLEFGNYNLLAMQGVLNAPLTDNQALRLSYASNRRDGYISSNAGESDLSNARVKYRWQATDDLNFVLTYEQQRIGGNGQAQSVLSYDGYWEPAVTGKTYDWIAGYPTAFGHTAGTVYMDRSDPWDDGFPKKGYTNGPFYDTKLDTLSSNIDWNLGFGTLTLLPSYQRAEFASNEPNIRTSISHQTQEQKTYQFEARLASAAGSRLQWLGGVYWYDTSIDSLFGTEIPPNITPTTAGCITTAGAPNCYRYQDTKDAYQRTTSAYANITWPIIDELRLLAGVRYSRDKKGFKSSVQKWGNQTGPYVAFTDADYLSIAQGGTNPNLAIAPNGAASTGLAQGGTASKTFSGTPYRVGVEYDVLPDAMAYLTYSKGYQAGNVQLSNYLTGGTPEFELNQITLGFKSRWFDDRLQANVEAFNSEFKNQPSAATPTATVGITSTGAPTNVVLSDLLCPGGAGNAGTWSPTGGFACARQLAAVVPKIKSKGVDLELNWLFTTHDRVDATVEWLDSVQDAPTISVTADQLAVTPGIANATVANQLIAGLNAYAQAFDGRTLQNAPKWSANASYSHVFQFAGGGQLTPRVNAVYKSSYYTSGFGSVNIADPVLLERSTQKAYTLWNAFLGWQSAEGKFHVDAYIKNIENTPVLLNYNLGGPVPAASHGAISLDAPRTFGVVFGVKL
ncbi:MAG: TonB-dependent receptor [Steroidobacteraceae bacterium]